MAAAMQSTTLPTTTSRQSGKPNEPSDATLRTALWPERSAVDRRRRPSRGRHPRVWRWRIRRWSFPARPPAWPARAGRGSRLRTGTRAKRRTAAHHLGARPPHRWRTPAPQRQWPYQARARSVPDGAPTQIEIGPHKHQSKPDERHRQNCGTENDTRRGGCGGGHVSPRPLQLGAVARY